jgi:hypothetical protein
MDLVILDSTPNRENTLVYAKPLQIYKGIDNKIRLLIKNQDQKLQNLIDTTIVFNLIDSANYELVFSRAVAVSLIKGAAVLTLDEADLNDVAAGMYNYSVKLISGEGETKIVYADDNFNAQGQARVNDSVYPQFFASSQPNLGPFYNNNPNRSGFSDGAIMYTDVVNVFERVKARSVLQTVQYYGTNFTGTVEVQGTMEAAITAYPTSWFTIDTRTFTGLTGCRFSNFQGKIGLVRFKITTTSGTLTKILYRP